MKSIKHIVSFLFLTCVFSLGLKSQNANYIDSLKIKLKQPKLATSIKINILHKLSNEHYQSENYFKAIQYKLQELKTSQKIESDSLIANCNERLGMMYYRIGNYDVSSNYFIKSLSYFENHYSPKMTAQITGNLANVYTRLENYKKALKYLFISKNILTQKEFYNKKTLAGLYINIGLAYEGNGILDSAMFYYKDAQTLIADKNIPLYKATIFNNLGEVEFKLNQHTRALKSYEQSLAIFSTINNLNGIGSAQSNIAKVDIKLKKYNDAIVLSNKALINFKKIKSLYFIVVVEQQLSEAYEGLKEYKLAIKHLKLYLHYNDSLKGTEIMDHVANLDMQYAVNKEQQKLKILEQQSLITEKEEKLKRKNLYIAIGSIVLLLVITILIIVNMKGTIQRNKLKREILKQQKQQLQSNLTYKQKEIENFAGYIQEKNNFLDDLKAQLKTISASSDNKIKDIKELTQLVNHNLYIDSDRKELEIKINQTHQEFIHRLQEKFPKLTKTEIRLCSLLLLNFSSKDIANIMNIATASVKTSRNRLRKKLELPAQADIAKFLNTI